MSKKLTEEQKKANKQKRLADKYEKQYGEIGRKIEKTIKDLLAKYGWVIYSEVYDENFMPVSGRFNITTQFIPNNIAKKIVKKRIKNFVESNNLKNMSKPRNAIKLKYNDDILNQEEENNIQKMLDKKDKSK